MHKHHHQASLIGPTDYFGSGLVKPTAEQLISQINASGMRLDIFSQQDRKLMPVSVDNFDCEAAAVLGQRGQGKSNTITRIVEQIIPKGLGMSIFDVEGEYYGLKGEFEVLCVGAGNSKYYDIQLDTVQPAVLAEAVIKDNLTVVIDFSDVEDGARTDFVYEYLDAILKLCSILKNEGRPAQHLLVIEEVQLYAPEDGSPSQQEGASITPMKLRQKVRTIAQRGRKRGLGLIVASQRTAAVDKTLLSQCSTIILHKVTLPNDIAIYNSIMGGAWNNNVIRQMLSVAMPGDAFVYLGDTWHKAHVLPQDTIHLGYSPKLSAPTAEQVAMKDIEAALISKIIQASALQAKKVKSPYQTKVDILQEKLAQVTRENAFLQSEKRIAVQQYEALKNIKVSLDVGELSKNLQNSIQESGE